MATKQELKFKVTPDTQTAQFGQFTLEPLERGFGITVGNALRRTLLTSVPGAAIISFKIDGVLHEFDTIDGVLEDVTDIIMNLKRVRIKARDAKPEKVSLSLKGPGKFSAKDIGDATNQFKVLNPGQHIATLNKKSQFTMEIQVGVGKGYVPAEGHYRIDPPIGTIFIDAIFSPVTKVFYDVQPVSSAKGSLERLIIEVASDGTTSARDCLSHASRMLCDHFTQFVMSDAAPVLQIVEEADDQILKIRELLNLTIDEMELSVRSHNCLQAAGIRTIADLVQKEESEMLLYKNFGRKSLTELVEKLTEMGLHFGMDVNRYLMAEKK